MTAIGNAFRAFPSKFNVVRVCLYITVILWSVVCLAIAAHFQSVLNSTELTRFVPFAIFVSVASILVTFCLLAFGIWSNMNPITVRIELACLGLVGTFWLALGAFLASSDAQNADVECFASDDSSTPTDEGGFTTETYQAQYRVLLAFSLFNVILISSFLALLLLLAIRRNFAGDKNVWHTPVPNVAWFGPIKPTKRATHGKGLPAPATEKATQHKHTRTTSRLSISALFGIGRSSGDKQNGKNQPHLNKPSYTKPVDEHYVWVPAQPPPGASRDRDRDRYRLERDNTRTTAATGATRLDRVDTRMTGTTLGRDNTRSTQASRGGKVQRASSRDRDEGPSRSNTRSTQASRKDRAAPEPMSRSNSRRDREIPRDNYTAPPVRTNSRRDRDRERPRERSASRDRGMSSEGPSRSNTRSTQATRVTTDSRRTDRGRDRERASERAVVIPAPTPTRQTSNSRKPDYYRRDLSPRR